MVKQYTEIQKIIAMNRQLYKLTFYVLSVIFIFLELNLVKSVIGRPGTPQIQITLCK